MKSMRIFSVIDKPEEGTIHVVKEVTNDDDSLDYIFHIMPKDIFEWRSVEYGISDLDELIDIVLHEPYVDALNPIEHSVTEVRNKVRNNISDLKSRMVNKQKHTPTEAITTMRQRGMDEIYISGATDDHSLIIKEICLFDDKVIRVKGQHIDNIRKSHADNINESTSRPSSSERARIMSQSPYGSNVQQDIVHPDKLGKTPRHSVVILGG